VEQRQHDRLQAQGFRPLRRVLLIGPPGTGKTFSPSALAGELRLPLFVIRLDGLITKFMGETAAKLRRVFDALAETRGVYLFDEVDALGGHEPRLPPRAVFVGAGQATWLVPRRGLTVAGQRRI
jgi:SpoVK/Ycf46/Vps4 family AAA+-type ATPase